MVLSVPAIMRLMFSLCLQNTKTVEIVAQTENTQPGINVGPNIGNKNRSCGMTPAIMRIAQIQDIEVKITDIIKSVNETFLLILRITK